MLTFSLKKFRLINIDKDPQLDLLKEAFEIVQAGKATTLVGVLKLLHISY